MLAEQSNSGGNNSTSKHPLNGMVDSTATPLSSSSETTKAIEMDDGGHEHAWIESIAIPAFAIDNSQRVLAWNQRTSEITGISSQDILHRPITSVIHEQSREMLQVAVREFELRNENEDKASSISSSSCDLTFCKRGDPLLALPLHLRMLAQQNTSGRTIGIICFAEEARQPPSLQPKLPSAESEEFDASRMIESLGFPMFEVNSDGVIDSWNCLMEEATGYSKEDVRNKPIGDFAAEEVHCTEVHEWFQETLRRQEQATLDTSGANTSRPIAYQMDFRGKRGETLRFMLSVASRAEHRPKQNRGSSGCLCIVSDVTKNLQLERTNGSYNSTFEFGELGAFVESARVPIFHLDLLGKVSMWNSEMSALTGIGKEDVLGVSFVEELVCAAYYQSTKEFFHQSLLGTSVSSATIETEIQAKSERTMHLSLSVVERRRDGGASYSRSSLEGLIVYVKESISRQEEHTEVQDLIETANAPIFGINCDGQINVWNSMTANMLGFSKDFVMGKSFVRSFVDPILQQSVQMALDKALEGRGTTNFELEVETKSGEIRYLLVNLSTRRRRNNDAIYGTGDGEIAGVLCFAQDVTEAAQHDRAVAAMARELRQLIDTANTAIFGVDTTGRVNEWNDKIAEISGYSGEEAFNEILVESFVVPSLQPAVQDMVESALRGRGTSNFELEIRTKTNEIRYLLVNATTRRDAENNIVGVFAVAQDVTEACKHDRAVAAMANELRQLIDTANAPIFGIDRDGDVNEWNDKTAEITGYTKEEAFDCSLVETFIVPSMRDSVQDVLDNALEGRGTSNYELEFRTKSNEIRHLLVNATTRRDAENNVVGVVGVAQDVTEAVQRDRAVAGMALELRQLIDTANAPIFGIDIDGNVNEWNRRTSEITGYTKEEAFDEPLVETFIAPSMQDKVQEILDSALAGNETSNYELEFVSRDGEPRFLLVNATTRRDPENIVVGVVGVAQDVTEDRKHAQALREMQYLRASQEAKVETERNMTAYFAHELRNPLGAIDSALNAMPDDLPEAAKSLISGMQLCTGFMSSIMNNLLDVRKMEEGKMKLSKSPISLKKLLNGVHKMLLPSVRPGVQFLKVCNTKTCDWVLGDAHRIQQVLTNVVTNAIKYTVTGSVTMLIAWEGDKVKFECVDTGPGIPKNEQEKLFQRFVQRGGAPGTGLGLAIAKHLVDLTGGSIRFDSDPTVKAGTTCVVLMPLALCEPPDSVVVESTALIQEPITFLIIDDIKMNRMMLKRRIMKGIAPNSVITEAATGEEALEICGKEKFDVIVADQYMEEAGGVMVGTDVVFAMRRMRIDSVIIGCSGNDMGTQFFEAGADWVWQKPMPSNAKIIQDLRTSLNKRAHRKVETSG